MSRALRRSTAAAVLAVGALTMGLVGAPAHADVPGAPPVTNPDTGSMYPGNSVYLTPLDNDTDADTAHGDLSICRLGTESYKKVEADFQGTDLAVFSANGAKPGVYTFTYYACDFSSLTAGTVTITILPPPAIKVTAVRSQPGKIRVTNPADFKISFLYGSFSEDQPDGTVGIPKNTTVTITVHRTKIGWIAYDKKGNFLKIGRVNNIKLPKGDHPPAAGRVTLPQKMATRWREAA